MCMNHISLSNEWINACGIKKTDANRFDPISNANGTVFLPAATGYTTRISKQYNKHLFATTLYYNREFRLHTLQWVSLYDQLAKKKYKK
jgi:hypothetical protein